MATEEKHQEIQQTGRAWIVAIVAIILAIMVAANNNKLPATAALFLQYFALDPGKLSFLMSLNGYVGIILAFFAPVAIMKLGTKNAATVTIGFALVGCLIMTLAPNYPVLVVGKLIEGAAYSMVNVVIPLLISEWFPPAKRGIPMGIFSIWVPIGAMFIMTTSGFFFSENDPASFRAVFWYMTVLLVIVTVAWIIAGKNPEHSFVDAEAGADAPKPKISEGFKSPACWIIMIAFAMFSVGVASAMNFETTYFTQQLGFTQAKANSLMNIANIGNIAFGIIAGVVLTKVLTVRSRLMMLLVACIEAGIVFAFSYLISGGIVVPWLILFGIAESFIPPTLMTMITQLAPRPELAPVASSMIALGVSVGGLLFTFVGIAANSSWGAASAILLVAGIILILCPICLMVLSRGKKTEA